MKYKIEKNTVQETLILPLYSRKLCSELYPNLYRDETAVRLIDEIDYDFSEAEKNSRSLMQPVSPIDAPGFGFSFLISACRVSTCVSFSSGPALILSQCFLVNSSK